MIGRRESALCRLERISIEAARQHGDDMPRVLAAIRERVAREPDLQRELEGWPEAGSGDASEAEERLQ